MTYFNRFITKRLRQEFQDFCLAHETGYYDRLATFYINMIDFEDSYFMDYGCGNGELSFLIRKKVDCSGNGVDLSVVAIEEANSRNQFEDLDFKVLNFELDNYEGNRPDIILSHSVFQYIQEPKQILKTLHQILNPGGHLIIAVPNVKSYHPITILQWIQFLLFPNFIKKLYPFFMKKYCQIKLLFIKDQSQKRKVLDFLQQDVINSKSRYISIPPTNLLKECQWKRLYADFGFEAIKVLDLPVLNSNNPHFVIIGRKPDQLE